MGVNLTVQVTGGDPGGQGHPGGKPGVDGAGGRAQQHLLFNKDVDRVQDGDAGGGRVVLQEV